jgi:hypothetical protein
MWEGGAYNEMRALNTIGAANNKLLTSTYFFLAVHVTKA